MEGVRGINHVAFSVADLKRSIAFYERFGFKVEDRFESFGRDAEEGTGVPDAHLYIGMLRRPDLRLELIQYAKRASAKPPRNNDVGSAHVCFDVKNIEDIFERLRADGLEFVSAPHYHESGIKWVHLKDPDGITVELLEVFGD